MKCSAVCHATSAGSWLLLCLTWFGQALSLWPVTGTVAVFFEVQILQVLHAAKPTCCSLIVPCHNHSFYVPLMLPLPPVHFEWTGCVHFAFLQCAVELELLGAKAAPHVFAGKAVVTEPLFTSSSSIISPPLKPTARARWPSSWRRCGRRRRTWHARPR